MKKTVLILCTGNSCRSQMAEAILNHDLPWLVHTLSSGLGSFTLSQVVANIVNRSKGWYETGLTTRSPS